MSIPVTITVAATLALLTAALGVVTMAQRVRFDQSWGDGGHFELTLATRAHANLTEYAPIFLIVLGLLESRVGAQSPTALVALGVVFVGARVAYLLYAFVAQALPLRILGFWGTVLPIIAAAGWLLAG